MGQFENESYIFNQNLHLIHSELRANLAQTNRQVEKNNLQKIHLESGQKKRPQMGQFENESYIFNQNLHLIHSELRANLAQTNRQVEKNNLQKMHLESGQKKRPRTGQFENESYIFNQNLHLIHSELYANLAQTNRQVEKNNLQKMHLESGQKKRPRTGQFENESYILNQNLQSPSRQETCQNTSRN